MKATHAVKINGAWYRTGEEIPRSDPDRQEIGQEADAVDDEEEAPAENEEDEKKSYTKKDITFMKVADLRDLAAKEGIVLDPDNYTGAELKEKLIQHFSL